MSRIFLLIAICFLVWYSCLWWRKNKSKIDRKDALGYGLWILLGLSLILVISGRVHWLMAAIAAIFPLLKSMLPLIQRALPIFVWWKNREAQAQTETTDETAPLNVARAREILGVEKDATRKDIQKAYKSLMQKVHPDRGGNDYLARLANEAKEILLSNLEG